MCSVKTDWQTHGSCECLKKNLTEDLNYKDAWHYSCRRSLLLLLLYVEVCFHRVSAVVHRGRRGQKDGGVLLPGPAEEHPPLHFQEPWPPRPLWSPVAQAEHFCAEQHSVDLHGLQALGEKADRREGRRWPHRAHAHHHTGGGWTACGRTCQATKTIPEFVKASYQKLQSVCFILMFCF